MSEWKKRVWESESKWEKKKKSLRDWEIERKKKGKAWEI